ncbi:STAG domain-containing protein [Xylogone sp. PMI_703]|nr:STAG domain-containing protein [Xylogone sp. PMI_703]
MPLMEMSEDDARSSPATAVGRRKSGRVVKAPEKFIPQVSSSQRGNTKRKRGDEDVTDDESNPEEEDEDEEMDSDGAEDEDAAEEELREKRKRTKAAPKPRAAKKPKVNGTQTSTVKLPSRTKAPKRVALVGRQASPLYTEVFGTVRYSDDIAAPWLERYNSNNTAGMTELVNFVFQCAGCDLEVTEDDINDPDNVEGRVGDLQQQFQAQNITDYPLISKSKATHDFRVSLVNFFKSLIKSIHASGLLYDDIALIETLHLWIATMSSSTLRPFRHTATAIALAMTSAMCDVAKSQAEETANTSLMLEAEKKKKGSNKARLADFQKKVAGGDKRKEQLENIIKDFYDTVFVHRYRDVDPKIRTECVEALGQWITTLPILFFDGQYLRYLGWMLSDINASTRHEVIKQLERILKTNNTGGMRHFIERFRPRIIEIAAQDSEASIRSSAVDLVVLMRECEFLEPEDIDKIGKLIFDSEPRVRRAVVGFFVNNIQDLYEAKIEELGGEETVEEAFGTDGEDYDSPHVEWIKYKCLAETLLSYDAEDEESEDATIDTNTLLPGAPTESRLTLAAQVLYRELPEIRTWEILAGYLLFDHSSKPSKSKNSQTERALREAYKPAEGEESILLEVLTAVVKIILTQTDDSDRSKKKSSKADTLETKESTTRHLVTTIPKLLSRFGADSKTATIVLRLEHALNLGVFQELRQDATAYARLLDQIGTQFNGHADRRVLNEASAALLHARSYEELEEITENKMQSLWEDNISMLRKASKAGKIGFRGTLKSSVLTELSNTLARIDKLASISSCIDILEAGSGTVDPPPIDIILDIVARGLLEEANPEMDELEDDVVLSAIRSGMFYFMWKVRALSDVITASGDISDHDFEKLRERQNLFATNLVSTLSSRGTLDPVRMLATGTLLDLHTLFATLRPSISTDEKYSHLKPLVREITSAEQAELTSIFEATERNYAKKSRKTLAAPGDDDAPEDVDSEDEEADEETTDAERHNEMLVAEQQLCDLSGKLVLAIVARVIDASGPQAGKLKTRIQRNRNRLGHNFKEVLAYLDEPKPKKKAPPAKPKGNGTTDAGEARAKLKSNAISEEFVGDDEDEEEIEVEVEEAEEEGEGEGEPIEPEDDDNNDNNRNNDDEDDVLGD